MVVFILTLLPSKLKKYITYKFNYHHKKSKSLFSLMVIIIIEYLPDFGHRQKNIQSGLNKIEGMHERKKGG